MIKHLLSRLILLFAIVSFGFTNAFSQTGIIKGIVSELKTGETLPGANVYIENTTIGISTDINGYYELTDVPIGKVRLSVSFIGYTKQTRSVSILEGELRTVNFELSEDKMMLDELVVIGYGSKRKRDITSSISKIKSQEIENIPTTSFATSLQGLAPGVQVTQDNGMAGGGTTIRIRGTSSLLASSEPLYVVDGVPIFTGSYTDRNGFPDKTDVLSQISPDDIESIEILKDASAAAIYGARSANGVILITTKKGKEGKTKFNVSYYAGIQDVTNKLSVLDGPTYLEMTQEAFWNSVHTEEGSPLYDPELSHEDAMNNYWSKLPFGITKEIAENTNTNWIDKALRQGFIQNASLSASGGTSKTTYFLGGSYLGQNGILKGDDFYRFNTNLSLTQKVGKIFKFGANIIFTYSKQNRIPTGWAGGLGTAQSRSLPIMPVYDSTGNFFAPKTSGKSNIVAERTNLDYTAYKNYIIGNVWGELQIFPCLKLRSEFGINNLYQRESKYEGTIIYEDATATDRRVNVESWSVTNMLTWDKSFNDIHNLSALIGIQAQSNSQYDNSFTGTQFPSPELRNPNSASKQSGSSYETGYGFLSYFGRFGYNFKGKYLIDFSIRRDGSSRFGKDHRWGWFPAGSAGWILTDESFMENIPVLSFFKLRVSYGITGNAEIGNFSYLGTYYPTKYDKLPAIGVGNIANPKLHWEQSNQFDAGFDFGLWEGRVSGGFDYYFKKTSDMLLNVNVPQTSGSSSVTKNVGKMDNKGFELFINSNNLIGEFKWTTDINLGRNKNEIIDIQGQILSGENFGNNFAQEGHPIGAWRLVEFAGIDPETGKPLFINQETGEKTLEWDFKRDAVVVGNPYPDIYGGINNTFHYKGFDFNFLVTFALGQDVYRDDGKFFEGGKIGSNWNQMSIILERWQKPGDVASIPKLIWEDTYSTYNTTQYLNDASYWRFKVITLGYTFPKNITDKLHIDKLRIYIQGTNLITITDYPGWDPEVNRDYSGNITQGVTYLSPPQAKTYQIGINLQF